MLYIPKMDDYLKILTDEEVNDFAAINFSEYFKLIREEQNLRKVTKSFYILLATPGEVEKYIESNSSNNCIHRYDVEILKLSDPELQLINTKPMIKNKSKQLLGELKEFKVETVLVLDYKKINDYKIFHSSAKLIASDSDIDEAFKSMHQSIIAKIKYYACEKWIKHNINIYER